MSGRFAEVWEFDRNGPPHCGTAEQQGRVLWWFERFLRHGTPFHRVLQALDRKANAMGESFYVWSFIDDPIRNPWATATRNRITVYSNPDDVIGQDWFDYIVPHEFAHVVGWNLLNPIDRSELWAEDFRTWVLVGTPPDHPVATRLKEYL
jgi:hypothetical protein